MSAPHPPMPGSVPDGLRLELVRAPIRPGQDSRFTEWMQTLHDRYDELLPTLAPERAALEAIFRHQDSDGTVWIYHLSLVGEHGSGLTDAAEIDRVHDAYSRSVKEPGWEHLQPRLLLAPDHIRVQLQEWGRTGTADRRPGGPVERAGAA